jgi:single-strand DNA-binding protein
VGSLNRCTFIGNLGRDAELRYTPGGDAVATLNLACNETWKDKAGQKQERTEWIRIVLWGKLAESLNEYLTKGKQIYVEGRMQTRKWEKEGVTHYSTEIKGTQVVLLSGGGSGGSSRGGGSQRQDDPGGETGGVNEPTNELDDDIPF